MKTLRRERETQERTFFIDTYSIKEDLRGWGVVATIGVLLMYEAASGAVQHFIPSNYTWLEIGIMTIIGAALLLLGLFKLHKLLGYDR